MALAAQVQAGWVFSMTVKNVRSSAATGAVTFVTNEPVQNPNNCPTAEFYGILATDNPKQALAILLTAQATGAKLSFYLPDGAGCDGFGRPRVTDVLIGTP
ncbi:hypothetical protein [Ramlibacter sp. AN1133]|uniref:hypothetical protein n=1 Tax=Ramlibacter sp. AN1133 TaxID=3133429 RepID=UPI0030BEBC67